jgi:cytochrome P450
MSEIATAPQGRIRFNPMDPAFRRDPYPMYARLREDAPYLRTMGTLVLTRHADVLAALKDRRFSVDLIRAGAVRAAAKHEVCDFAQAERFIRNSLVFTDNPEHTRLRRLINQALTPRMMGGLEPIIAAESLALIEPALADSDIDAVERFAAPLPVNVLCRWIGLPTEARAPVARHIHAIRHLLDPGVISRADCVEAVRAVAELTACFVAHIRQVEPCGDHSVISALSTARGADGERLDEIEVAFACIMFFVAGTETSQCLIGNLLEALVQQPHTFAWLKAHPERIVQAVEESIRNETPLQMTKRVACEPLEINGHPVRAGEQVLLCLGAANRDPQVFADPDMYRLDRSGAVHVGFGSGMHTCLGAGLARLQTRIFTTLLLARCVSMERTSALRQWLAHSVILRGPAKLPLRITAGAGQRETTWSAA